MQKKYKLVVLDMDGTLLTDASTITGVTIDFLNYLHKKEIIIAFATARVYRSAWRYAGLFSFNIPLITTNGSLIKDSRGGKVYFQKRIPVSAAKEIIARCREMNLYYKVYIDSVLHVAGPSEEAISFADRHQIDLKITGNIGEILEGNPPEMIVVLEEPARIDKFIEGNKDLLAEVSYIKSEANSLEIGPAGVSKGRAVKILAQRLTKYIFISALS
ncbi:MAG: hypothetical protein PWR10_930 [Halanaerobiales bacterium]|nr:hypothetical protein [Halanaerobiales bacterium]